MSVKSNTVTSGPAAPVWAEPSRAARRIASAAMQQAAIRARRFGTERSLAVIALSPLLKRGSSVAERSPGSSARLPAMERRRNFLPLAGFLVCLVAFLSYVLFFYQFEATRDVPWT